MNVNFKHPCNDCPFRRASTPGWLGASGPDWFIESALADVSSYGDGAPAAPCHQTVDYEDPDWLDTLSEASACTGALIFAKNLGKIPRFAAKAAMVAAVERDTDTVFATPNEFREHHLSGAARSWEVNDETLS